MSTDATISNLEERLRSAQLKSDTNELSLLLDDSLVFSALDGAVAGKIDDISLHKSPDFRITRMNVIDREIRCHENAAIVNVLMDAAAEFGGSLQSNNIRYIRVWYRFSDGWRIISGSMRLE